MEKQFLLIWWWLTVPIHIVLFGDDYILWAPLRCRPGMDCQWWSLFASRFIQAHGRLHGDCLRKMMCMSIYLFIVWLYVYTVVILDMIYIYIYIVLCCYDILIVDIVYILYIYIYIYICIHTHTVYLYMYELVDKLTAF